MPAVTILSAKDYTSPFEPVKLATLARGVYIKKTTTTVPYATHYEAKKKKLSDNGLLTTQFKQNRVDTQTKVTNMKRS